MRLIVLALGATFALALLNLAQIAGASYARFASDRLDRPESPATAAAARIAAKYPPWSSPHLALHGWVLTEQRDGEAAEAVYLRALRLAPGDPLLWSEYALVLARLGRFDDALTRATQQAQTLAPTSAAVRRTISDLGITYWVKGTPEQRALWLKDLRRERDADRASFLTHVLTRGRLQTFCRELAPALNEDKWCDQVGTSLFAAPRPLPQ